MGQAEAENTTILRFPTERRRREDLPPNGQQIREPKHYAAPVLVRSVETALILAMIADDEAMPEKVFRQLTVMLKRFPHDPYVIAAMDVVARVG